MITKNVAVQQAQNAGYSRTIRDTTNVLDDPEDAVINMTKPLIMKKRSTPI